MISIKNGLLKIKWLIKWLIKNGYALQYLFQYALHIAIFALAWLVFEILRAIIRKH